MRNLEAQEVKGISGWDLAYRDPKLRNMTATELLQLGASVKAAQFGFQYGQNHCPMTINGFGPSASGAATAILLAGAAMGAVRMSFGYAVPAVASAFPGSVSGE